MKFSDLVNMVDLELKQVDTSHLTYNDEAYKLARKEEIKNWANQSLKYFVGLNPHFWRKVVTYTIPIATDIIELPTYYKEIFRIKYNGKWYRVYNPLNDIDETGLMFFALGGNRIKVSDELPAGTEIMYDGYLFPDTIVNDDDEVDIPMEFERLLVLAIVLKYAARDNVPTNLWVAEYKLMLNDFMTAMPRVRTSSKLKSRIRFE